MQFAERAPDLARPDQETIQSFFDAIPERYDFLNSFLSLGLDAHWRRKAVRFALDGSERRILDLGVGTGKSLAAFLKAQRFDCAAGCDFSCGMLRKAQAALGGRTHVVSGDFHKLPFPKNAFDIVTGSFILRSVQDLPLFLSEAKRVLAPGGKAAFLELTRPVHTWFRTLCYVPYLKFYLPLIGGFISRRPDAYRFLSQSIQHFMSPADLSREFESAGFSQVAAKSLSFGAATIIKGRVG